MDDFADRWVLSTHPGDVPNIRCRYEVLDVDGFRMPISIQDDRGEEPDSWVVSYSATFGDYALEEIRRLERPLVGIFLRALALWVRRRLVVARADRMVQVGNYLLSTNLHPPSWDADDPSALARTLAERFPDHAIGIRSLNRITDGKRLQGFLDSGWIALPSRRVWIFDLRQGFASKAYRSRNCQVDGRLLRSGSYQTVHGADLKDEDWERLADLYAQLYLRKYCPLNPEFTAGWMRRQCEAGTLSISALRRIENGSIDAFAGMFENESVVTVPMMGYDMSRPRSEGLYRLASRLCMDHAADRGKILNFSSGAGSFKKRRGALAYPEWSFVHVAHLPVSRQRVWRLLSLLLRSIALPLVEKLDL